MLLRCLASSTLLLLTSNWSFADEPIAANAFALPPGLEITLWARAPQFFNPTNIDVDIHGRVWVAEAVNYRRFNSPPDEQLVHAAGDRIVVLEDTDRDGVADASHVFVQDQDLIAPLGIAVLGNRVIVSCSPSLLMYTDLDGDARFDPQVDKKEVLLTGFGGLDHDHGLHSLVAGPDGRWYFNVGNAGAHTVTDRAGWTLRAGSCYTGGTPYNTENIPGRKSDDGRVYIGGLALAMEPDGTGLSVHSHNFRNNYEICLDSLGNVFQNDNDDQVAACRTTWLMPYSNAGYCSADGSRTWQADQRPGQSVPRAHWHQDDPGVIPMGDLYGAGSPTGMVMYESNALGEQFAGMLLSCEAGRNVVFGYRVSPQGAGYRLERFPFVTSGLPDNADYRWKEVEQDPRRWFRPSDVAVGPDGAIYIADWFDPIVGGHAMHDRAGTGAIYRIAPKQRQLTVPPIDLTTPAGQVAALKSPAPNVRFLGFERLRAAGERSFGVVEELLDDPSPYVRARAIWLLAQLGSRGQAVVAKLFDDPDAATRVVALRALQRANGTTRGGEQEFIARLRVLARDPSPAVRRETALALRDFPLPLAEPLLIELAQRFDGSDRWYLEAWGTACEGRADKVYQGLLTAWETPRPDAWDDRLAALVWRLHPPAAVASLFARALTDSLDLAARRQAIDTLGFIADRRAAEAMAAIALDGPADTRGMATWWIDFRRSNLWRDYAEAVPPVDRVESAGRANGMAELQQVMLDSDADGAARRSAAEKMAQSHAGALRLIALAARGTLPNDLRAIVAPLLHQHEQPSVRALAAQYYPQAAATGPQLPSLDELAKIPGDAVRGRQLATGRGECTKCHRFGSTGNAVGPDLSDIGRKLDRQRLVESLIDPSAAIAFGYETWIVITIDGRVLNGFLIGDGDTVLLKDAEGKQHAIAADQIDSRSLQRVSLMPPITSLGLTAQDLADIAEFLSQQRSEVQPVPSGDPR